VGQPILFGHEQLAAMNHRRRIGHGAQVGMRRITHRRIIRVGIAVVAVELVARLALLLQPVGVHEAAFEVHLAALEAEAADVAVGIEDGIIRKLRRVVPLVPGAVERTVQVLRNLADDFAVLQQDLETQRRIETASGQTF
jgi:hypothetical protein